MNKRQARLEALGGLTAAASLACEGHGDAFRECDDKGKPWTDADQRRLRLAFMDLHDELASRLERLRHRP